MAHDLDVLIGQTLEDRRVVRRAALGRQLWEEGGAPL